MRTWRSCPQGPHALGRYSFTPKQAAALVKHHKANAGKAVSGLNNLRPSGLSTPGGGALRRTPIPSRAPRQLAPSFSPRVVVGGERGGQFCFGPVWLPPSRKMSALPLRSCYGTGGHGGRASTGQCVCGVAKGRVPASRGATDPSYPVGLCGGRRAV